MDKLVVKGGVRLAGTVKISGAKNAALPMLAGTILSKNHPVVLQNVPHLKDVTSMLVLLSEMGTKTMLCESTALQVDTRKLDSVVAPYELVKQMRASILVLGPLLGRFGKASVSLPGGCAIGSRPVDMHLSALEAMGAKIHLHKGYIDAHVEGRLQGASVGFDKVTVTGTENIMMAAVLADGTTHIDNAACEPEVVDLAQYLNAMGANIHGAGSSKIAIKGVEALGPAEPYAIMADRIEAGTYLVAAAMTKGDILIKGIDADLLHAVIHTLKKMGAEISCSSDGIRCQMHSRPIACDITTGVYPDFPTDMQAQLMVLNAIAKGTSHIQETIFENRFMHVQELIRMGANLNINGNTVTAKGISKLTGAEVMATDLRASACLVLAGLAAQGQTTIDRVYHLCRGYERMEEKLQALGAKIERKQHAFVTDFH